MIGIHAEFEGFDQIAKTIDELAPQILGEIADSAVNHLAELDRTADASGNTHNALADLWTHTVPTDDGQAWTVEIFSKAEEMTFYNPTTDAEGQRVASTAYPISGRQLLMILEAGARAHFIFPRNAKALAFPNPGHNFSQADFKKRYGFAYERHQDAHDTVVTDEVLHPGVVPDHHVADTAEWLEQTIAAWGEEAADRIAVKLA